MVFKFLYFLFLCNMFCYTKRLLNKQLKIINVSYSLNNKYINFFYTSLYSLLENSDKNTIYHIYIQVGDSFAVNKKLRKNLRKYISIVSSIFWK